MAVGDSQSRGDSLDTCFVQDSVFDQTRRALGNPIARVDAGVARRQFRSAAQARTIAHRLGRRGTGKVSAVLGLGRLDRADGAAVDTGGSDPNKEPAIKARIVRPERAVTHLRFEQHGTILALTPVSRSPFSDIDIFFFAGLLP